ncbi:TonB-dependent receptor plug domain-containing protein [Helicobacter anatolicus]|uniref:TonB-dependent receptor plug domain-containing protein n=1 Tax=Helicobacter anatolicus TaxID=2905874 RepID=UPI001E42CC52|nr:TonB-dependent receptor [Helicobacter anatolicus]MCE3040075.1 TonB-dependent receptor plug domain-containing protein [Helicobacter anatolicus]
MKTIIMIIFTGILLMAQEEILSDVNQKGQKEKAYNLDKIYSVSSLKDKKYLSGEKISQEMIQDNPNGNGDITSLLRILPNVQFDNKQLSSQTAGEIDPANISISGGLYYQNLFLLDGAGINNDLNPIGTTNPTTPTSLLGRSQGMNIDTSLLGSIKVLDSNISASYGGFSGGVVEAETKRPTKKFSAKISQQISQGDFNGFSLTKYHINEKSQDAFINSTSANSQPKFIKYITRASLESKINEKSGVIASFSANQSFIPLKSYAQGQINQIIGDKTTKTQKRLNYNAFIKGYYDILSNLVLEASYTFAPQYNEYFIVNTKDSDFYLKSGGHQANLKSIWDNTIGNFTAILNFGYLENSRTGSAQNMKGWRYSTDKNWNVNGSNNEGGYGNVSSKQINLNLKLVQEFDTIKYKKWLNKFSVGTESGFVYADYHRLGDTIFSGSAFTKPLKTGETCLVGDEYCSNGVVDTSLMNASLKKIWENNNGQYMYRSTLYKQGLIAVNNFTLALFIEDDMSFLLGKGGMIESKIGLRSDFDTFMSKTTFAPRFSIKYITPVKKDYQTSFVFGANRYYGRNIFNYALLDGRSSLEYTLIKSSYNQSWSEATATQNKNDTNFKKIRVPYSDELMGGIQQNISMFSISAKYIHRFGRDEVRRACKDSQGNISTLSCASNSKLTQDLHYVYTNEGKSDTDIVTLSIQNDQFIGLNWFKNYFLFAFDFTNIKRNYADYNENLTQGELDNQYISYNGKIMRYADRPASNFVRPFTIRLNTTHHFYFWRTKWLVNNFFRYRSAYNTMISVGNKFQDSVIIDGVLTQVPTFKTYRVRDAFTWDMRIGFEVDMYRKNTLFVNLDIFNLLDTKNIAITSLSYGSAGLSATPVYEIGRSFYIEVGYKY